MVAFFTSHAFPQLKQYCSAWDNTSLASESGTAPGGTLKQPHVGRKHVSQVHADHLMHLGEGELRNLVLSQVSAHGCHCLEAGRHVSHVRLSCECKMTVLNDALS